MHKKEMIHPSVGGEEDKRDNVLAQRKQENRKCLCTGYIYKIYVQGMHNGRPSCTQGAHRPVVHPKMLSTR